MHSISVVRNGLLVALLLAAAGAHAQQRSPTSAGAHDVAGCTEALRNAGYRDMLIRFPVRQATFDSNRAVPTQTSYRDASRRLPVVQGPTPASQDHSRPRYALRPSSSCG